MQGKPFSQASENNKRPIGTVLSRHLRSPGRLLEIGSGTGQHGHFFAQEFPHITWQPSDRRDNLPLIQMWVNDEPKPNYLAPREIDVNTFNPVATSHQDTYDYLYSANTAHIMSIEEVTLFFGLIPQMLTPEGLFFLYGPFNYQGQYTSESNARFDEWLKAQAPHQGIRDFEAINALAMQQGLSLIEDNAMPANNRTIVWQLK